MDSEMLYEYFGFDAESDISGFLKAINSYCECLIPKYFDELNLIKWGNDNFIKQLKSNNLSRFSSYLTNSFSNF